MSICDDKFKFTTVHQSSQTDFVQQSDPLVVYKSLPFVPLNQTQPAGYILTQRYPSPNTANPIYNVNLLPLFDLLTPSSIWDRHDCFLEDYDISTAVFGNTLTRSQASNGTHMNIVPNTVSFKIGEAQSQLEGNIGIL